MDAHFGAEEAAKRDLHLNFAAMKREYQNYERWYPAGRIKSEYERGEPEEKVQSLLASLKEKGYPQWAGNRITFHPFLKEGGGKKLFFVNFRSIAIHVEQDAGYLNRLF